ncbi:MAG: alpha/beta hydrolase [Pseudomonadota bacterium]
MNKTPLLMLLAALLAIVSPQTVTGLELDEQEIRFEARSGESTLAYEGSLLVPEYRGNPDSRMISMRYVRFPSRSDTPRAPLVYLSGGPGGSGTATARGNRYALFVAMAEFTDVIALDQRGTGLSDAPPVCRSSQREPGTRRISDDAFAGLYRAAVKDCASFWAQEGTDLRGYTTSEIVQDLSALREHLGAEKLSLWGISYGSHLALAAMKDIPGEIERVIIASVEGLDQTVKLPARTDAYFAKLGESLGEDDLPGMMQAVHETLDDQPVLLSLNIADRGEVDYLLQRRDVQMIASASIADPGRAAQLVALYKAMHGGNYDVLRPILARFATPDQPIALRAMPIAVDRASGISAGRLAAVTKQSDNGLLGPYLNFPMPQILGELQQLDLGNAFRTKPTSAIPTLVFTGSLDGRTYPESQREAISGLSDATTITIEGAGHNLFMTMPEVGETMGIFLQGRSVEAATWVVPASPD